MFKKIQKVFIAFSLLAASLVSTKPAHAASLVEYALLSSLIAHMEKVTQLANMDFDKALQCYTVATKCSRATAETTNAKNEFFLKYARAIRCASDLKAKLGRAYTSTELQASCGEAVNAYLKSVGYHTSAIGQEKLYCEEKTTACAEVPLVF